MHLKVVGSPAKTDFLPPSSNERPGCSAGRGTNGMFTTRQSWTADGIDGRQSHLADMVADIPRQIAGIALRKTSESGDLRLCACRKGGVR